MTLRIKSIIPILCGNFFCFCYQRLSDMLTTILFIHFQVIQIHILEKSGLQNNQSYTFFTIISAEKYTVLHILINVVLVWESYLCDIFRVIPLQLISPMSIIKGRDNPSKYRKCFIGNIYIRFMLCINTSNFNHHIRSVKF